jgi:hypothetical protein
MSMFFLVIALVASAFLGIQLLFLMFGGDMDFDADIDVDAGDLDGFLSIRSLTAFFGGFGWAGLAARQADWSGTASIAAGIGVGTAFFFVVGFLFLQARKLSSSGNVDYRSTIDSVGTVYLSVPPHRSGSGKVELSATGSLTILDALTDDDNAITSKTRVRVIDLIDNSTVLVERV